MKTQQIARAGLCVALLAVSAWVSVPLGPIPFTLQTMTLALIPAVLDRPTAILAVAVYLLLGAIGLPVFSGYAPCRPDWRLFVGLPRRHDRRYDAGSPAASDHAALCSRTRGRCCLARHFLCVRNGPAHGCRFDGRGACHGGGGPAVYPA